MKCFHVNRRKRHVNSKKRGGKGISAKVLKNTYCKSWYITTAQLNSDQHRMLTQKDWIGFYGHYQLMIKVLNIDKMNTLDRFKFCLKTFKNKAKETDISNLSRNSTSMHVVYKSVYITLLLLFLYPLHPLMLKRDYF